MREITLYIAVSLDGFIADRDGGVSWLDRWQADEERYAEFIRGIDTVVMGWNTYFQVTRELSPGCWPYAGLKTYVCTHRPLPPEEGVEFTSRGVCSLVRELARGAGKGVWVCGGADTAQQLIRAGLIGRYWLTVLPVILGGGVRLFGDLAESVLLRLVSAEKRGDLAELILERAPEGGSGQ